MIYSKEESPIWCFLLHDVYSSRESFDHSFLNCTNYITCIMVQITEGVTYGLVDSIKNCGFVYEDLYTYQRFGLNIGFLIDL